MARGVWLLAWLQMYRPPALDRSILKLFCQREIIMRGRDGRTTILQRIGYALAILTQLHRMECHLREDAR